jgi:hypothetical protein
MGQGRESFILQAGDVEGARNQNEGWLLAPRDEQLLLLLL